MQCFSCKNKRSKDRCSNSALNGLLFCGIHAHAKNPRLWEDLELLNKYAQLIQKVWRGHVVRMIIRLAGPGCLKRSLCHNETELVSMDEKERVYPFDYFGFNENGRVYWFDIRSISEIVSNNEKPQNPYTREPLSFETRQRIRKLCVKRHRKQLPTYHIADQRSSEQIIKTGWIHVCHVIEENGFFDMSPEVFLSLNKTQLYILINLFNNDLKSWASEHTNTYSRRRKYVHWMKLLLRQYAVGVEYIKFLYLISRVFMSILNDSNEQYSICFMIMSALYRL
jgi:hypothetical protein